MTDKEFKRLSRSQLIDIIYQLQLKQEELTADNEKLSKALADKRLRVSKVGNIAEAALEIHNVMQSAQDAADHYLEEIKIRINREYQRILKEAKEKAADIIEKAQEEADEIVARAKKENPDYDPVVEAILKENSANQ
jgi:cell division septum initiation protein DivIVA